MHKRILTGMHTHTILKSTPAFTANRATTSNYRTTLLFFNENIKKQDYPRFLPPLKQRSTSQHQAVTGRQTHTKTAPQGWHVLHVGAATAPA
jgi:hypothetical protein